MFNSAPYAESVIGRRFGETMIELMYQPKWTRWWTVQPEMQYIIRPSGGVLNSGDGLRPNALVIALRSTISF
jgi:porin